MLGMGYIAQGTLAAVTTADTLLQVTAPADAIVVITKIEVSQFTLDASEDTEIVIRTRGTAGTGGTAVTPRPTQTGFAAAGSTWLASPTAGTGGNTLIEQGWNVLSPFIWHPTPEEYIVVSPSGILQIATDQTITSATVHCSVSFMEIGG